MEAVSSFSSRGKLESWIIASRPAFHTVGVFPYTLGAVISYHYTGAFDWPLWLVGTVTVMLIMLATHLSGECFDHVEDRLSWGLGPSRFAGGAGVIPRKLITRRSAFLGSVISIALAIVLGLVIWIGFGTGPWTIPLGLVGIIGGFFYSSPPLRWVATGYGEIWIGVCYGFLTVAVGLYLPYGELTLLSFLVSIPIAATIFNVIFANEYPDYDSDRSANKSNLLSRVGRERGVWIYSFLSILANIFFFVSLLAGVPSIALVVYSLPMLVSFYCVRGFLRGDWKDKDRLEVLCGLGILVNLSTTFSYIIAFAAR